MTKNKYNKKYKKDSNKDSKHVHQFEKCIVRERNGIYTFLSIGKKCKYCKKLMLENLLLTNKVPKSLKDLPIIDIN